MKTKNLKHLVDRPAYVKFHVSVAILALRVLAQDGPRTKASVNSLLDVDALALTAPGWHGRPR